MTLRIKLVVSAEDNPGLPHDMETRRGIVVCNLSGSNEPLTPMRLLELELHGGLRSIIHRLTEDGYLDENLNVIAR